MKITLTQTDGKQVAIDSEKISTVNDAGSHRVVTVFSQILVKDKGTAINKMMHGLPLDDKDK